jgi:hypothetical protein
MPEPASAAVLFDNLRNAIFERVGQDAARRLAETVFRHIHALSLRFHLERRTGAPHQDRRARHQEHRHDALFPAVQHRSDPDRAQRHLPDLRGQVRPRAWSSRPSSWWSAYISSPASSPNGGPPPAADERGRQPGDRPAVDSLLNYETVKYFNAEEREAERYGQAMRAFADAAVKNETSLAWLNIGQSLITNLMMAGAMGYTVGAGRPACSPPATSSWSTPCSPSSSAARHARLGLPHHPPGPDRHGRRCSTSSTRRAEVKDVPGAPDLLVTPAMSASRTFISAMSRSARY